MGTRISPGKTASPACQVDMMSAKGYSSLTPIGSSTHAVLMTFSYLNLNTGPVDGSAVPETCRKQPDNRGHMQYHA